LEDGVVAKGRAELDGGGGLRLGGGEAADKQEGEGKEDRFEIHVV
jgi:hypothetical protein